MSALVTELKVIQSNPGPEGAQAARDVPIGEGLASELHAWGHGLPGATEPDRPFVDEWIAAVDYLTNEAFRP